MTSLSIPPLLEIRDVVRHFPAGHGRVVHAVDGVSLSLQAGETLALVGESGCGKSTLGRLIVHLERPDSGSILLDGQDIARLTERQIRALRIKMQMIFQDPSTSLDPRWTVDAIIREPLNNYRLGTPAERTEAINVLLAKVGLQQEHARRFPHELSGGQKQRVGIARALAVSPKLIVADEPVSALDVSVRAQVINLLSDLKDAHGLSLLLISHDIGIVAHISARIAVMYLGRIVEIGQTADVLGDPKHPYTRALLEAVPVSNPAHRRHRAPLDGDPPSPTDLPKGCSFQSRCPHVKPKCGIAPPPLQPLGASHAVACVRATEGEL